MKEKVRDRRVFTCISSAILVALTSPLMVVAMRTRYPKALTDPFKPMYFPMAVLGFIIAVCAVLFVYNLYRLAKEREIRRRAGEAIARFVPITGNSLVAMIGTVIYGLSWRVVGFSIGTVVFMALLSKKLSPERSWKQIIVVSIATSIVVYMMFVFVFKVPFPEPLLDPVIDWVVYR